MKKVLIFSHALEIGGAERALLGLLNSFDTSRYEVDLFLMRHEGELFRYIPDQIRLLPSVKQYTGLAVPMTSLIRKKLFRIIYGRLKAKILARRFIKRHGLRDDNAVELEYSHKYTRKYMPSVSDKEYDLAISFLTPHYFVAEKVMAKRKIAWIHTDYSYVGVDVCSELEMWDRYDRIASISPDCTKSFLGVFPELKDKIVEIENISSADFIRQQAAEATPDVYDDDRINLLSIGRFCHPKNFDNVPDICKRIRDAGINARWFLIGFGPEEDLIRRKIKEVGMEEHVIVIGKMSNPYPYIANCDIYVQPSRYEGKAVTVREAQILSKPVVITAYPTSASQLADGFDGVIVPMDNAGCAEGIARVIRDDALRQKLIENTGKTDYSGADEIQKLYALIG